MSELCPHLEMQFDSKREEKIPVCTNPNGRFIGRHTSALVCKVSPYYDCAWQHYLEMKPTNDNKKYEDRQRDDKIPRKKKKPKGRGSI